jgi:hypothetical protein
VNEAEHLREIITVCTDLFESRAYRNRISEASHKGLSTALAYKNRAEVYEIVAFTLREHLKAVSPEDPVSGWKS